MALEFVSVAFGDEDTITSRVAIPVKAFEFISEIAQRQNLLKLGKASSYWEDVVFDNSELPYLAEEILKLIEFVPDNHRYKKELDALLNAMFRVVKHAEGERSHVELLGDTFTNCVNG